MSSHFFSLAEARALCRLVLSFSSHSVGRASGQDGARDVALVPRQVGGQGRHEVFPCVAAFFFSLQGDVSAWWVFSIVYLKWVDVETEAKLNHSITEHKLGYHS